MSWVDPIQCCWPLYLYLLYDGYNIKTELFYSIYVQVFSARAVRHESEIHPLPTPQEERGTFYNYKNMSHNPT